jgi:hypothetical protein
MISPRICLSLGGGTGKVKALDVTFAIEKAGRTGADRAFQFEGSGSMRIFGIAGVLAAALSAPPAAAQPVPARATAGTITRVCNENQAACLTYVVGSLDAFFATMTAFGRPPTICIPPAVNNNQLMQVGLAYLRAHPEVANANGAEIVIAAIHRAYPCQTQPGR